MSEIDLYGVYVPGLLGLMFVSFLFSIALRRLFAWVGVYAFVWHRGLFDVALYVVLLGSLSSLTQRLTQ
jgi:hypothetical protein